MSPKEILQQVINEGMWDGTEPKACGDYAASWDASKGVVAIADSGGWWTINRRELTEIAAVNELQIAQLIDQRDALLAALKAAVAYPVTGNWHEQAAAAIALAEKEAV